MDVQHFRVKLFAAAECRPDLGDAIQVFHRWIQEKRLPEVMIDVSDYAHVPSGPGVILVCHEAIYGLDEGKGRLGLVYSRRTAVDGSIEDRLLQAVNAATTAAALLEREPEFTRNLRFDRSAWEVTVNDRALAPNTDETWNRVSPAIQRVFDLIVGAGKYSLDRHTNPRELFGVTISGKAA